MTSCGQIKNMRDWLEEGKKFEIMLGGKPYQGTITCIEQDYLILEEKGKGKIYISIDKIEVLRPLE